MTRMTWAQRIPFLLAATVLMGLLLVPTSAQAQLQEVEQTVFGMDCAPCAHALENRLGNTKGVATVSVSLNEGRAVLKLDQSNSLTLEAIREAVIQSGFSPQEATVRLTGVVKKGDGTIILSTDAGESYKLTPSENASSLQRVQEGKRVTVTGQVPKETEGQGTQWTMKVQNIDPVS